MNIDSGRNPNEANKDWSPELKKTNPERNTPAPESQRSPDGDNREEPVPAITTMESFRAALQGAVDTTRAALRFESAPKEPEMPEMSDEERDELEKLVPQGIFAKMRQSKLARGLFVLGGLIGVGKNIDSVSRALENINNRDNAVEQMQEHFADIHYESVSKLPGKSDTFKLDDGTEITYGSAQHAVDGAITEAMGGLKDQFGNHWGGDQWLHENMPTTLEDGSQGVDSLHATIVAPELAQANAGLNDNFYNAVALAHGMSAADVHLYDDMMRGSLWQVADSHGGMPGMHEAVQDSPLGFDTHKLQDNAVHFSDTFAKDVLQTADLDHADKATQGQVIDAVQQVINAELELQRAHIDSVSAVSGGDTDSGAYFMHEWKTTGGETRQAGVTELHSAETKADLAAKILAESDPALKPIADQLLQMNHTDNVQFYNSGAHSGFNADFWQGQLQDARASYGMPDLAENPNSSESKG